MQWIFPKGTFLQVVCKNNESAIKIQNVQQPQGSKINGALINQQDVTQLWFIQIINDGKDYEFANALSDLVFQDNNGIISLKKGNWNKHQQFKINKVPLEGFYEYYWIRPTKNSSKAVTLQGVLRTSQFNQNDDKQMFRFEPILSNNLVNRSVLIRNSLASNKVLDVPNSSQKQCQEIVQWQFNNRFNQRWLFVKTGGSNIYQIQSLKTGLNLDINGESKKPGTKIIQYKRTASSNQLWMIQRQQDSSYFIRSVHSQDLYLSLQKQSIKDGAKIIVSSAPFPWKLQGDNF